MDTPRSKEFALAAALAAGTVALSISPEAEAEAPLDRFILEQEDPYFTNEAFFERHSGGRYTTKEERRQTETLEHGEKILHDAGLDFYRVERGDSITRIRKKLSRYPQYRYLTEQTQKIASFNIPNRELRAGMWLPIPLKADTRAIDDNAFIVYAKRAIDDMKRDPEFGDDIGRILNQVKEEDLVATLMATAKQEAGDQPIGQFALHRWEPHHKRFSFSLFHILMKGAGLQARQALDMTEGQTYHPENACKLFLAFLAIKSRGHAERYFPIDENLNAFATFYNGAAWKKTNPQYTRNIKRYYTEANQLILHGPQSGTASADVHRVTDPVARIEQRHSGVSVVSVTIGQRSLYDVIKDINYIAKKKGVASPLANDKELGEAEALISRYLNRKYPRQGNISSTDRISIGIDQHGSFIIFNRDGEEGLIRLSLEDSPRPKEPDPSQPTEMAQIARQTSLQSLIRDINYRYRQKYPQAPIETDESLPAATIRVRRYLEAIYGDPSLRADDELSIGIDKYGAYLKFRRGTRQDIIRIER